MTRDEIITLAGQIAQSLQDADSLDVFVNDVFYLRALLYDPDMVEAKVKAVSDGTAVYDYESDMLRLLYAIMHDELLSPVNERALDAYNGTWDTDTGTPTQVSLESETARQYRLYPEPDFDSSAFIPVYGEPFGRDFPDNSLVLIYADDRESGIAPIHALPIAFAALASEFSYPSDHTDEDFSQLCADIGDLFDTLLRRR